MVIPYLEEISLRYSNFFVPDTLSMTTPWQAGDMPEIVTKIVPMFVTVFMSKYVIVTVIMTMVNSLFHPWLLNAVTIFYMVSTISIDYVFVNDDLGGFFDDHFIINCLNLVCPGPVMDSVTWTKKLLYCIRPVLEKYR